MNAGDDTLLLEIGKDHCCYAFSNDKEKSFGFIRYIVFDEHEGEEGLSSLLKDISATPSKVIIGAAYEQAMLLPVGYAANETRLQQVMYDLPAQKFLKDTISEGHMVTAYSMPENIYRQFIHRFPSAIFCHIYTPSLKMYNGFVAEDQVNIHFSTTRFSVLVKKDNQVQLVQTYSYKTPLDVVYYLLKICYEFAFDQSHVFMIISGLIDKDSALYTELHHYFINVHFTSAPSYSLPENEHPHYYFTSLYNLAACGS